MDDKDCLENLLLDIDIFNELKRFTNNINLFDILKISSAEIKHSIVLSYLLNPSESHGLGSKPLELFFKKLSLNNKLYKIKIFDLLDVDYYDFSILREYKNIDILIKSTKNKLLVCIENKIWTSEHDNQLIRYKETIDKDFLDYNKIFIYLTPNGYAASDNNWSSFSYENIIEIIDELNLENINEKIKFLIEDYKLMVRRKIMNDYELKELCNKIYKKHKQAFDLILENKDDDIYYLYSMIHGYLKEKAAAGIIKYDEKNSSKTYLRFTTPDLEKHFPLLENNNSSWKSKHTVFYEIILGKIQLRVQIAFGFNGVDKELRHKEASEYLRKFDSSNKKYTINDNYLVKTFNGRISFDNISLEEEQDRNYIYNELDQILEPIFHQKTITVNSKNEFSDLVKNFTFRFAKTYADKAPHEYAIAEENTDDIKAIRALNKYIQENFDEIEIFWNKEYPVLFVDNYKYWSIDEWDKTTILNRNWDFKNNDGSTNTSITKSYMSK